MNENDLMNKLMVSKKIMDIHSNVPRGQQKSLPSTPMLQDFDAPQAKYNISPNILEDTQATRNPQPYANNTQKIMSSKLPDEIKRLMIEHPITQPTMNKPSSSVLSDELIEKASRLMNNDVANNVSPFQPKKQKTVNENTNPQVASSGLDKNVLKNLIKETIEEVLSENGLLVENVSKSNDVFQFRVGSHIFEGKVLKIKKVR